MASRSRNTSGAAGGRRAAAQPAGADKPAKPTAFAIRFTPRKKGSRWSLVNLCHVKRLEGAGRMHPAGLAVLAARDVNDARRYAFESQPVSFSPAFGRKFRARARAWRFFQSQPPWYQRTSTFWVMSAKREETREKRLAELIERSEREVPIQVLARTRTGATQSGGRK